MNELKKEYNAIIKPMFYNKEDWTVEEITKNVWAWFEAKLAQKEPKWIITKEKTPGFNIRVLGLTNKGGIYITFEDACGELDGFSISTILAERGEEYFTHWQPLRELPEEK